MTKLSKDISISNSLGVLLWKHIGRISAPLAILLSLCCSSFQTNRMKLPTPQEGWSYPGSHDIDDFVKQHKKNVYIVGSASDKPFTVKGDFNGDGYLDSALIMLHHNTHAWGVFIFLFPFKGAYAYKVYENNEVSFQGAYISMAPKSDKPIRTARGKGYWACGQEEPSEVFLSNDSVYLVFPEMAHQLIYWDSKVASFRTVSISD